MARKQSEAAYSEALKLIDDCRRYDKKSLNLTGLYLNAIPPGIGQLKELTELDLRCNALTSLPPEIMQLTGLTHLILHGNLLTSIPPEIEQLSKLTLLHIGSNKLTAIPPTIGKLNSLTHLKLRSNQLNAIPPDVGQLSQLISLELEYNQLQELPESLRNLHCLKELTLRGNEALKLPKQLIDPSFDTNNPPADPHVILDYYFARRLDGEEPMREVRLLLVGRGRVGKTSLLKSLRGETPDENELETPGITVKPLQLKCSQGTAIGRASAHSG